MDLAKNAAEVIKRDLMRSAAAWLPGFERRGQKFTALNPTRNDGTVGSYFLNEDGSGWDFATGEPLDIIAAYAAVHGMTNGEAFRQLMERHGFSETRSAPRVFNSQPQKIAKPSFEPTNFAHPRHGNPRHVYAYRDMDGTLLGYTCRFEREENGKRLKEVLPYSFSGNRWKFSLEGFPDKAPIYGAERLSGRDIESVLIVEGEKTADAAQRILPLIPCLSWLGGCQKAKIADFSMLSDRKIYLWPDADSTHKDKSGNVLPWNQQPGFKAMIEIGKNIIAKHPEAKVYLVTPPEGVPCGWDLADAEESGEDSVSVTDYLETSKPFNSVMDSLPKEEATNVIDINRSKSSSVRIGESVVEIAEKVKALLSSDESSFHLYEDIIEFKEILSKSSFSASSLASAIRSIKKYYYVKESTLIEALVHYGFRHDEKIDNGYRRRKRGPKMNAKEILDVIENELGYKLRWNEVLNALEVNGDLIDRRTENSILKECYLAGDEDREDLESSQKVLQALYSKSLQAYHPIKDYLEASKREYQSWAESHSAQPIEAVLDHCDFENESDREWFKKCFEVWLKGAASKVYNSAYQNPVFTLIGAQGAGKGTFCQSLAKNIARRYFREDYINPKDKDCLIGLATTFIWEVGEIGGTTGEVDPNHLKAFLTKPVINVRMPYDKTAIEMNPLASFIGTSNDHTYLVDSTGNRRFLSVKVRGFDHAWFRNEFNPNTLWGWAMSEAEKAGFSPGMPNEMREESERRNETHRIQDPVEAVVENLFELDESESFLPAHKVMEQLQRMAGFANVTTSSGFWKRLHKALDRLGVRSIQKNLGGKNIRGFVGVRLRSLYQAPEMI
jgi:predicted P-loop ATPase